MHKTIQYDKGKDIVPLLLILICKNVISSLLKLYIEEFHNFIKTILFFL